ncbi:MAG: hypothetical protein ACI89L_002118 [Phycisphaerales bacterium]|jgi:hypothetical protein
MLGQALSTCRRNPEWIWRLAVVGLLAYGVWNIRDMAHNGIHGSVDALVQNEVNVDSVRSVGGSVTVDQGYGW